MPDRYLLYIDMLGFSDLVLKRGAVRQLYNIIDSLNVHDHHAFKTIAFSDTLLVYNTFEPETDHDRRYAIMYMCEFAKDLHYRLVPLDLHFRGFLTKGEFEHEELRHMQAFYGAALISSYQREKNIDCTGLFLDAPLLSDCDIFFCEQYDQDTYFIHLMQALNKSPLSRSRLSNRPHSCRRSKVGPCLRLPLFAEHSPAHEQSRSPPPHPRQTCSSLEPHSPPVPTDIGHARSSRLRSALHQRL
jgi:hypothetical protein